MLGSNFETNNMNISNYIYTNIIHCTDIFLSDCAVDSLQVFLPF